MIVTSPAISKEITITFFRVFCVPLAHFLLTNHKIILFLAQMSQKKSVKIVCLQFFAISKTTIKRIKVLETFADFFVSFCPSLCLSPRSSPKPAPESPQKQPQPTPIIAEFSTTCTPPEPSRKSNLTPIKPNKNRTDPEQKPNFVENSPHNFPQNRKNLLQ